MSCRLTSPALLQTNAASVVASEPEPTVPQHPSSSSANLSIDQIADLHVTKTASPSPVVAGEDIEWAISVRNAWAVGCSRRRDRRHPARRIGQPVRWSSAERLHRLPVLHRQTRRWRVRAGDGAQRPLSRRIKAPTSSTKHPVCHPLIRHRTSAPRPQPSTQLADLSITKEASPATFVAGDRRGVDVRRAQRRLVGRTRRRDHRRAAASASSKTWSRPAVPVRR